MSTTDLVPVRNLEVVAHRGNEAANFMPVMDITQALARRDAVVAFTRQIMKEGLDYGTIPGSAKPCLLKAGAEKLCTFFGLVAEFQAVEAIEDWTGEAHGGEPLFYYRYKCRLFRNGNLIGEGEGSCSSWESKYRYRWVDESYVLTNGMDTAKLLKRGGRISEFDFAVDKAETVGRFAKPAEYWQRFKDAIANGTASRIEKKMGDKGKKPAWEIDSTQYRVSNPDICDVINTCQKMGQKRSLIAGTLIGVNASEYFTQDLEDKHTNDDGYGDPPPPYDDEPPTQNARSSAPPPQQRQQTPSTPPPAPDWDVRQAVAAFAELREAHGVIRFNELWAQLAPYAKDAQGLKGREDAKRVYNEILLRLHPQHPMRQTKEGRSKAEQPTASSTQPAEDSNNIWGLIESITDIASTCKVFEVLKRDLMESFGENGETIYYDALRAQGVEKANQFRRVAKAKEAAWALYKRLQEAQVAA